MFVLVRKPDRAVVSSWPALPDRVPKPGSADGVLCLGAPSPLPFDLGDYVLAETSVEGYEPFDPAVQNRTGPAFAVAADYAVTETWTVADKTQAELDALAAARDEQHLRERHADGVVVLISVVDALLASGTIPPLSGAARAAYLDLKPAADRIKARSA